MVRKKEAAGKVFRRSVSHPRSRQTAIPSSTEPKRKETTMLKTFTIAAVALGTAAAIPPLHAHEFLGIALNGPELMGIALNRPELMGVALNGPELMGVALNGPELMGIALNGPELMGAHFGTPLNGPSLSGQVGPLAPDEAGMRVVALRRPSAAK